MVKYLVELNIGIKLMEDPISTSKEIICDTRKQCVEYIKQQIENNAKANIEECKKRNTFYQKHYEEMDMPSYEFGKIQGEIVDCVVNWTKKEWSDTLMSKIKYIFTKQNTFITKKWYWWYNIYPIPYINKK